MMLFILGFLTGALVASIGYVVWYFCEIRDERHWIRAD